MFQLLGQKLQMVLSEGFNKNGPKLGIKPVFLTIILVGMVSKVYILLMSRVSKTWF